MSLQEKQVAQSLLEKNAIILNATKVAEQPVFLLFSGIFCKKRDFFMAERYTADTQNIHMGRTLSSFGNWHAVSIKRISCHPYLLLGLKFI